MLVCKSFKITESCSFTNSFLVILLKNLLKLKKEKFGHSFIIPKMFYFDKEKGLFEFSGAGMKTFKKCVPQDITVEGVSFANSGYILKCTDVEKFINDVKDGQTSVLVFAEKRLKFSNYIVFEDFEEKDTIRYDNGNIEFELVTYFSNLKVVCENINTLELLNEMQKFLEWLRDMTTEYKCQIDTQIYS